jgi:NifU-like protein involved in Fe-S cluster formation
VLGNPDAVGQSAYTLCRDNLIMFFRLADDHIAEVTFEGKACGPVVAVASYLTGWLKGRSVQSALELSVLNLDAQIGGLPPAKRHALLMVLECLHQALADRPSQLDKANKNLKEINND